MEDYNKVAAKWWADKLRNVDHRSFDNGDNSSTGSMMSIMAAMLAMQNQPSSEAFELFEEKLADAIKTKVEERGSLTLDVDYHPDFILGTIAEETGINPDSFPWKTTMWIKKDSVTVSAGYRAPSVTIFPVEE